MSKMSNINLELQEQANELGFSTTQEALDNGYHVVEDLVAGTAALKKLDEQEQAHEAWLKEKRKVLNGLKYVLNEIEYMSADEGDADIAVIDAIKFIEGVSHE